MKRSVCFAAVGFTALGLSQPVAAQEFYKSEALASASAFESKRYAFFLRGGYAFDSTEDVTIGEVNALLDPFGPLPGDPDDELYGVSAFYSAVGLRFNAIRLGNSAIAFEGETLVVREEENIALNIPPFAPVAFQTVEWAVIPNAAVRWQYNIKGRVSPFVSAGMGPAFYNVSVETDGFEVEASDTVFSYNARAGVEFKVSSSFGVEAAYRHLGVSDSQHLGFHAAEIALNFHF